ncbi:hypothetical protein QVD17_36903 [Tagetes erecta]|uniref:Uncharacterized protein n=1 Tax=Tagetes erecta TaxID=13708 RepID=A0AAD8JX90_TARER|nr:hypothetical protein QVD17_36903 [Tagetes erecta]
MNVKLPLTTTQQQVTSVRVCCCCCECGYNTIQLQPATQFLRHTLSSQQHLHSFFFSTIISIPILLHS